MIGSQKSEDRRQESEVRSQESEAPPQGSLIGVFCWCAASGKRTLIVRWSRQRVIAVYLASVAVAFALVALGPLLGRAPAWTLIALPAGWLARPGSIPAAISRRQASSRAS